MNTFLELFRKGTAHCQHKDYEKGIEAFSAALELNPSHVESLYSRAKANFALRRFSDCLDDLGNAIATDPSNAELFSERAVVFYHQGLMAQAMDDLDTAVNIDDQNPYRYASRAFIKDKAGDYLGAIEDYNKAIFLDPEDAISYNNRGLVEEKLGYRQRSKISFEKADALTGVSRPPLQTLKNEKESSPAPKSPLKQQTRKFKLSEYVSAIKGIFNSRDGFKEFLGFLIDLGRFKKPKL